MRTADGRYARTELRIIPKDQDQGAVELVTYFDPSGSRNLEFDPAKVVKNDRR